jgi:hypothetical protein
MTRLFRPPGLVTLTLNFAPREIICPHRENLKLRHPPHKTLIARTNHGNLQRTLYPLCTYVPIGGRLLCAYERIMSNFNQSLSDDEKAALSNLEAALKPLF